jgi:hypothetical protein
VNVDIAERIVAMLSHHPAAKSVTLVGSRARGSPTPLSDWDFKIDTAPIERPNSKPPSHDGSTKLSRQWWAGQRNEIPRRVRRLPPGNPKEQFVHGHLD